MNGTIAFAGELSGAAWQHGKKRRFWKHIAESWIMIGLWSVRLLIQKQTLSGIDILVILILLILPFLSDLFMNEKRQRARLPDRITFLEDTVLCESEQRIFSKKRNRIRRVYDYGEFYELSFWNPLAPTVICQKNLLKQGSLTAFEELFTDRIRKKTVLYME